MRCLPVEHDPMHRPALGRAAAHHAVYAVLGHELERVHRTALDRLPALDRQVERSRDEGKLSESVAAIRHRGRERGVPALGEEALVVTEARLKHCGGGREGEGLTAEEEAFVMARAEARFGTALKESASAPRLEDIKLEAPRVTAPASLPFCT